MNKNNKKKIVIIGEYSPDNINSLLENTDDIEIVNVNNIFKDLGLLYTRETEYQMEMIKQYDNLRYSNLSKKRTRSKH